MDEFQSWLSKCAYKSPSPSSSSPTTSQETHSTPTLCEDTLSFNSLRSYDAPPSKPSPSPPPSLRLSYACIATAATRTPQLSCLAVHNGALYAAATGEINVFDLETLALLDAFGPGSGLVKSVAFSGRGKVLTAHQDRRIRVWRDDSSSSSSSRRRHKLIATLPTFKDWVFNCFLPRNYVRVRRHEQRLWIEHADAVSALAVDDGVGLMYSVSWDKCLKTWRISSDNRCMESVNAHSDAVNAVAVDPRGRTVYTASADGDIKVWTRKCGEEADDNCHKHELAATLTKHESSVNALALTEDGSTLCSGGGDGLILVWERDEEGGANYDFFVGCCLKGHRGAVLCLVHVNGVLISGSSDRSVRVWEIGGDDEFRGCLAVLEGHCKPVKSIVAVRGSNDEDDDSLDGSLSVFSGSLDGEIRAWKVHISHGSDMIN